MKKVLFLLLLLISATSFCQSREYTGIVKDISKTELPLINVSVKDTQIKTETDLNGYFKISVPDSLNILTFSGFGMQNLDYKVGVEKHLEIILEMFSVESKFIDLGFNYDAINSIFGISLSNGTDLHLITHFEELTTDFLYKTSVQIGFNNDYAFEAKLSWNYPNRYFSLASLEFSQKNLPQENLFYKDISISSNSYLRFNNINLLLKAGYQELNEQNNFGASIGLQNSHLGIYYGFQVGHYSNYINYSAFFQAFVINRKISLRIVYDRIDDSEFLNLGLTYLFIKTTTNDIEIID